MGRAPLNHACHPKLEQSRTGSSCTSTTLLTCLVLSSDLEDDLDMSNACLEIVMETIGELQYKQRKGSIKAKATELFSTLGRTGSLRRDSFSAMNLPQTGIVRIPLSALLCTNLGSKPCMEFGGRFMIKSFSNLKMGEVTLHATPSPSAFTAVESDSGDGSSVILYQDYLTFEEAGEWKRYWACLAGSDLLLRDPKLRRNEDLGTFIDLNDLVKLDMICGHGKFNEIGVENCLELCFEDESQVFLYADSELSVMNWADVISRAVWGQPFSD